MTLVCRRLALAAVVLIAILAAAGLCYHAARAEAQGTPPLTLKSKGAVVKELALGAGMGTSL